MSTSTRCATGASPRSSARAQGVACTTAVHICYGYGIKANNDWKKTLGGEWRQYEQTFPLLARSTIDQVSLECANSHVPIELIGLLGDKDVLVGAIDVATDRVETPEEVATGAAQRPALRARRAHPALHQLRHGAAGARGGPRKAPRPGGRGGAGPRRADVTCRMHFKRYDAGARTALGRRKSRKLQEYNTPVRGVVTVSLFGVRPRIVRAVFCSKP